MKVHFSSTVLFMIAIQRYLITVKPFPDNVLFLMKRKSLTWLTVSAVDSAVIGAVHGAVREMTAEATAEIVSQERVFLFTKKKPPKTPRLVWEKKETLNLICPHLVPH